MILNFLGPPSLQVVPCLPWYPVNQLSPLVLAVQQDQVVHQVHLHRDLLLAQGIHEGRMGLNHPYRQRDLQLRLDQRNRASLYLPFHPAALAVLYLPLDQGYHADLDSPVVLVVQDLPEYQVFLFPQERLYLLVFPVILVGLWALEDQELLRHPYRQGHHLHL